MPQQLIYIYMSIYIYIYYTHTNTFTRKTYTQHTSHFVADLDKIANSILKDNLFIYFFIYLFIYLLFFYLFIYLFIYLFDKYMED